MYNNSLTRDYSLEIIVIELIILMKDFEWLKLINFLIIFHAYLKIIL